jgi:phage terminase large subunit-like protein
MAKLTHDEVRLLCEADLKKFARLVNPTRVYGAIHDEVMDWWQGEDTKDDTLLLLPRAHMKSHLAAVYAAWLVVKHPWITILYISATADLAEKQLYAIKNILDSKHVRKYWPHLIHPEEGKREKWSAMEIAVDHPVRKSEGVRDPTIKAAGLTTNITGFHSDHNFLDDCVVPLNAYTEEGRTKVSNMYSQLASIKNTGAKTTVVGTRYHPKDLYATLLSIDLEVWDNGEIVDKYPLYETMQQVVEQDGEFIWPKMMRYDGRYFGFDENELAKKRAEYVDVTQFYAQYYNNPNDPTSNRISPDYFQYYDKKHLRQEEGHWYLQDKRLNVFAAIDFAFSLAKKADYTALVVIGIDSDHNYYVLDIDRFKTKSIGEYYNHILESYNYWGFRKIRAEVTVAQEIIVEDLKNNYIRPNGLALSVDKHRPSRNEGSKEERMMATLEPRYKNLQIWHYKGGNCQLLEEELKMKHPPHDDIEDALTAAVDVAIAPTRRLGTSYSRGNNNVVYHSRFGGIRH